MGRQRMHAVASAAVRLSFLLRKARAIVPSEAPGAERVEANERLTQVAADGLLAMVGELLTCPALRPSRSSARFQSQRRVSRRVTRAVVARCAVAIVAHCLGTGNRVCCGMPFRPLTNRHSCARC